MESNLWTAASEGDLARVTYLIESQGESPNAFDSNSYTPLHAAASWSHVGILRYLVAKGGNINLVDGDGETPLFVVETAEMARVVLELGGDASLKNLEGQTAAQQLQEEYPHISLYLRSITGEAFVPVLTASTEDDDFSSASAPDVPLSASSSLSPDLDTPTNDLITRVRLIMEASERGEISSIEVDEKLREVVEEVVNGQVQAGREIGENEEDGDTSLGVIRERADDEMAQDQEQQQPDVAGGKRRREEAGR